MLYVKEWSEDNSDLIGRSEENKGVTYGGYLLEVGKSLTTLDSGPRNRL